MTPVPAAALLLFLNRVEQANVNVVKLDEYKIRNREKIDVLVLLTMAA
jgi:hypothetical protein